MREKITKNVEKWLKKLLKGRVSISEKTLVAFLISGMFGLSSQAFGAFVNDGADNLIILDDPTNANGRVGAGATKNILIGNLGTANSKESIVVGDNVTVWAKPDGTLPDHLFIMGENIRGQNSTYSIIVGKEAGIEGSGEYNFSMGASSGDARKGSYIFSYGEGSGHQSNGKYNFAFGNASGRKVFGNYNFAFGNEAGQDMGNGSDNISLMQGAGSQTNGNFNMAVGFQAGQVTKGNFNYAFGPQAGKTVTGHENIAIGSHAGRDVSGSSNYALGLQAGQNVSGSENMALGTNAGQDVKGTSVPGTTIQGNSNFAFGKGAGSHVIGNHNVSIAENAGQYVGYRLASHNGEFESPTATNISEYVRNTDGTGNNLGGAEHNYAIGHAAGNYIAGQDNISVGTNAGGKIDGPDQGGAGNIAIGTEAGKEIYGDENTAIGLGAGRKVIGRNNIAFGAASGNRIKGKNNIAIGVESSNTENNFVEKENTISLGTEADASKTDAIAIGHGAKASAEKSISIGTENVVSGANSGAIGDPSYITGTGTYTIGNDNGTQADPIAANNAGAFGNENAMTNVAEGSRIVGNSNTVSVADAFVVGNNVTANVANSVYLGKESEAIATAGNTTAGAITEYKTATITAPAETGRVARTITLGDFAGNTPVGVVTVGKEGEERRIQHVAAGKISAESTDAINGSQLYALASKMTDLEVAAAAAGNSVLSFTGDNLATTPDAVGTVNLANQKLAINGTIGQIKTTVAKDGQTVIIELADEVKTKIANIGTGTSSNVRETVVAGSDNISVTDTKTNATGGVEFTVDLAKDIDLTNQGSLTIGDTVINSDGLSIADGPSVTNTGIYAGDQKIRDVKDGEISFNSKDAINGSQLATVIQDGLKFQGDDNRVITKALGTKLDIVGGADPANLTENNIGVNSNANGELVIQLSKDIKDISSITLVDGNGNEVKLTANSEGLDMGGKKIVNVGKGENPNDVATVSQLKESQQDVKDTLTQHAAAIQNNSERIDELGNKMNSGLANAAAMATIEFQEIGINQAVVAAGVGTFNGHQAVAVGMETAPTENIRVNVKASVAPRGRSGVNTMAGVGASYKFNWK